MAELNKDTIYIDLDDEITNIIDKVASSSAKLVALVLPKRATVFQSSVNMKLLKRKSDELGKNVVLVTSDTSILPLAGLVGMFVSKTLNSRPEVPVAPNINQSMIEASEDDALSLADPLDEGSHVDFGSNENALLSQLASEPAPLKTQLDKDLETINLDNTALKQEDAQPLDQAKDDELAPKKPKKIKKDKSKKVPNFKRFKLILILILVVLITGAIIYLLAAVLPSATIDIKTNASNVNADVSFNLSTSSQSLNQASSTVPAKEVSLTKTYTATVNSTGQQNNGQKATGSVVFDVCETQFPLTTPPSIASGTGIVQNNLTYITQSTATFSYSNTTQNCVYYTSGNVSIIAQAGGSNFNTTSNNTSFTVPGYASTTAVGGASGGTDNMVTVVSQTDINNAQNKISINNSGAQQKLTSKLNQAGYYPIGATFTSSQPTVSENNQAGTIAGSVTVTETVNYTMYGLIKSDLITLLDNSIAAEVGSNQSILSTGLNNAVFSYTNGNSDPTALTVQSTAVVGPNIKINNLKTQIEGKNINQIKNIVEQNSNVTSVAVNLSPFYVSSAPNNPSRITINIAKPSK
jgi:hypothetical protein